MLGALDLKRMHDEYTYLWAQLGILTHQGYTTLLKKFGSLKDAWHKVTPEILRGIQLHTDTIEKAFETKERLSFEQIMECMREKDIKLYTLEDEDYPDTLKNIKCPPPFLFVRGQLPSFHRSLSVVGTRAHSDYGKHATEKFTADLVRSGFVIVSGLALGIDSIAHRITLEHNGITVAVLGSGVDNIYPPSNYRLAMDILSNGGAIISSYPLGSPAFPYHFPERNCIVAGLTQGTLVVEGGIKSGARITAKEALNYGRSVFAIPTNISNYSLSVTNFLVRNSEAKLVENADHILEDFNMQGTLMKAEPELTTDERFILERLALNGKTMDQLFEETTFNIPQLANILVMLQIKGVVDREYNRWVLA
jgi:DNA processing protein